MDWSKAKNILIIAFIITNIFLAYVLINSRSTNIPEVSDDFVKDVEGFLLEKNINLSVEIPRYLPSLSLYTIKYEMYELLDIARRFFGQQYSIDDTESNIYHISNGIEKVTVKYDNEIIYESIANSKKYFNLNKEKAEDMAKDFISSKGFSTDDFKLSYIKEENGTYFLEFTKVIDDYYFEKSYMRFYISETGVNRFERYWIESAELDDSTNLTIMSAPRALLKLLAMEEVHGKTIEEISISYYLDPETHIGVINASKTKGGKATPAWRILFSDGEKIFLEDN